MVRLFKRVHGDAIDSPGATSKLDNSALLAEGARHGLGILRPWRDDGALEISSLIPCWIMLGGLTITANK